MTDHAKLIERLRSCAEFFGPDADFMAEAASALEEREGLREASTLAISRLEEADKAEWGDDADALGQEARSILEAALHPSPVEGTGCGGSGYVEGEDPPPPGFSTPVPIAIPCEGCPDCEPDPAPTQPRPGGGGEELANEEQRDEKAVSRDQQGEEADGA